jgi:aminopeptidase YwaD
LLNAQPEFARRALATIHLDMIGGNSEITKSILRVHGSPPSLPSFVSDVGFAFGRYVNAQSMAYADTGHADMPLIDPAGDRRALQAEIGGFNEGSDHQVWAEGSWRVPIIYIADWPDRYIHTQRDVPENLDPTKMRRAMFIAAASGWFLATASSAESVRPAIDIEGLEQSADASRRIAILRAAGASPHDIEALEFNALEASQAVEASLERFWPTVSHPPRIPGAESLRLPVSGPVYRRIRFEGPMDGFGYSWFDDHLAQAHLPRPLLLARQPDGEGAAFGYEALNLVDGRRSVGEIRDELAATVGAAPVEEVAEYLDTLARLGVIAPVTAR